MLALISCEYYETLNQRFHSFQLNISALLFAAFSCLWALSGKLSKELFEDILSNKLQKFSNERKAFVSKYSETTLI